VVVIDDNEEYMYDAVSDEDEELYRFVLDDWVL